MRLSQVCIIKDELPVFYNEIRPKRIALQFPYIVLQIVRRKNGEDN